MKAHRQHRLEVVDAQVVQVAASQDPVVQVAASQDPVALVDRACQVVALAHLVGPVSELATRHQLPVICPLRDPSS